MSSDLKPLEFFFEGDDFFTRLFDDLAKAQSYIDIELYYLASDPIGWHFLDVLRKKVNEKVRVRLICDAVGCRRTASELFDELIASGVQLKVYNPLFPPWHFSVRRDHRKIVLIDGFIGYVAGFNIASEFSHQYHAGKGWRDTAVRFEQREAVDSLKNIFEQTWKGLIPRIREWMRFKVNPHILSNDGWKKKSFIRQAYLSALIHAQKTIYLTNPYFIPDGGIRRALRRAAKRGVDVRLLVCGETDVRIAKWAGQATYSSLLRAGVRIFEFQKRILHAKSAVVDDEWYTVGTSNIDHLSFFRNLEVNLFARNRLQAQILSQQFLKDLKDSAEILKNVWKKRSWLVRLREKFFFFFRKWL